MWRRVLPVLLAAPFLFAPPSDGAVPQPFWLTGDTHVHTDHSSDGSTLRQVVDQGAPGTTSVATQIDHAVRRGLEFLPLTDHRTYSQQWDPEWTSSKLLLIPGEEANGSPHANVLGAADDLVDGANPAGSAAFRHVQQSVWDTHAQDGVWQTNHPDDGETDPDGRPNANASVVGVDSVEVFNSDSPEAKIDYAENRWNAGFRFGAVAASDNHFSEIDSVQGPGLPATRVLVRAKTERDVLDAFRAGHTAVDRGTPESAIVALDADLDGNGSFEALGGDERKVRAGRTITLRVVVDRGVGTRVIVYGAPGRSAGPLVVVQPTSLHEVFTVPVKVRAGTSWYRAEVRRLGGTSGIAKAPSGLDYRPPAELNQLQAATSPVFVYTDKPATPHPALTIPASTGTDAARTVLGRTGEFTGFADVATVGGTAHVVAERDTPGRTTVVYRRDAGATTDLVPASRSARFPRVAASGRSVWVVWQDERSGQQPRRPDVYLRHSADGGRTWQHEIRLTHGSGRAERPVVALQGVTPVVAWMDNTGGAFDVLVQRLGGKAVNVSAPGKSTRAGDGIDARSAIYPASLFPSLAVSAAGVVSVGWQDDRNDPDPLWTGHSTTLEGPGGNGTAPDDDEIFVATLGRQGWGAPRNVSNAPKACDRHPSLVYDGRGVLHVAWDTRSLQASGANLSVRTTASTSRGFERSRALGLAPAAMSQRPRLSLTAHGAVRVVWYDSRNADWRWHVMTALVNGTGLRQLTGAGNATWPAVSGDRVAFTSDRRARVQRDVTQQVLVLTLSS